MSDGMSVEIKITQRSTFNTQLFFVYSAEVEDYLVVAPRQCLELVVGGEEHHDVGLVVGFFVVGELEYLVLLDVGLYYEDVGVVAALHHLGHDVFGGAFAQVVDIGFESQAHHGHAGFAVVIQFKAEHGVFHLFGAPECLVVVDFAGLGYELALYGEVGGNEVGINGNAVSAYATSGLQDVDTRVFVGQVDQFPHVDAG